MQLTVVDVVARERAAGAKVWLPRGLTLDGAGNARCKIKSGSVLILESSSHNGSPITAVAKAKTFSAYSAELPAATTKLGLAECALSAAIAQTFNCTKGAVVTITGVLDSSSIPTAKKVVLRPLSGSLRRAPINEFLLRQSCLGDYVVPHQVLIPRSHDVVFFIQDLSITPDSSQPKIARLDTCTEYAVANVDGCYKVNAGHLRDTWTLQLRALVVGCEQICDRLIDYYKHWANMLALFHRQRPNSPLPAHNAGVILSGPPGCGKTTVATAFARTSAVKFSYINCASLHCANEADAEHYLSSLLSATSDEPQIIILDELDAIAAASKSAAETVSSQFYRTLLAFLDGEMISSQAPNFVIGLSSQLHVLRPELMCSGRLEEVIEFPVPNPSQRYAMLNHLCAKIPLIPSDRENILRKVSDATHGFVASDMEKLCHAVVVYWNTLNPRPPTITLSDFQHALTLIRPASLGDLTSSIPKTSFMDLFGLEAAIQRIQLTVLKPFSDQGYYRSFGIGPPKGVLIYGPSGVGKSLLSYAIVHESGFNCVHVDGPKIRSRVVGESEQNIARIFAQARAAAPCILLIDNIDTVVPARGSDLTSENTGERIVTSFLTEMDGLFSKAVEDIGRQVFIVATTNRRGHIDPAILRPGRLDEHIHIPIPDNEARRDIFKGCLQKMPHSITAQDLDDFVTATVGYTGADIENVCREAAFNTLRKDLNSQMITKEDIIISMRR